MVNSSRVPKTCTREIVITFSQLDLLVLTVFLILEISQVVHVREHVGGRRLGDWVSLMIWLSSLPEKQPHGLHTRRQSYNSRPVYTFLSVEMKVHQCNSNMHEWISFLELVFLYLSQFCVTLSSWTVAITSCWQSRCWIVR